MTELRIGITGPYGYVGSAITAAATASGHEVTALARRPAGDSARRYDLTGPLPDDLLAGIDVVIHCAYDLTVTKAKDIRAVNIEGTRKLIAASVDAGARFLLISSMSAYHGTRQLYGQAKLESEQDAITTGGNAVRLGLVHGGSDGGMIGSLKKIAALPVIPVMGAHSHQFMVNATDMANGVCRLVEAPEISGQIAGLAHPESVRFDRLIRALAAALRRTPRLVPIPWQPVYGAMRLAEAAGVRLPLRADSVLGLVRPAPAAANVELWQRLGVEIAAPDLAAL